MSFGNIPKGNIFVSSTTIHILWWRRTILIHKHIFVVHVTLIVEFLLAIGAASTAAPDTLGELLVVEFFVLVAFPSGRHGEGSGVLRVMLRLVYYGNGRIFCCQLSLYCTYWSLV